MENLASSPYLPITSWRIWPPPLMFPLRHGGFGLHPLMFPCNSCLHCSSLSGAFPSITQFTHLHSAIAMFNQQVTQVLVPRPTHGLRVVPSPGLGLALEPEETHILLKWWLGLPIFNSEETCPYCSSQLDPLGHHSLTCRYAGDVVTRIRDTIARLGPLLEQGCGIGPGKDRSRPTDILIANWSLSRSKHLTSRLYAPPSIIH